MSTRNNTWLLDFVDNTYSQFGEDGVIDQILARLPDRDHWCVEFGAWDGIHLSNTRRLIEQDNYSAVLIEGDGEKIEQLKANYSHCENIYTINQYVGFTAINNLDHILDNTPIPRHFDFLSIDIDGNDIHAWDAMSRYEPKAIVIEFNPTIPTSVSFAQPADPSINQGSSLLALVELGKKKNYELVSVLPSNAFFVKAQYYELFEIDSNNPKDLRIHEDSITYLFCGYDGKIFLRGNKSVLWHGLRLDEEKFQVLPKLLRVFPSRYTKMQSLFFAFLLLLRQPKRGLALIRFWVGGQKQRLLAFLKRGRTNT